MSQLFFCQQLPQLDHLGSQVLVIYDGNLPRFFPPFRKWLKDFSCHYAVSAGEKLKDFQHFPMHIERILKLTEGFSPRKMTVVVVGGGSVGDFGGFVASVFKRGVDLVQIPTTWLSAMDSAHGGKNALNVSGYKNQVGTFHLPAEIYLVKKLLCAQPEMRAREAFGELAKIALLDKKNWSRKLVKAKEPNANLLWRHLKDIIASKNRIVEKDPFEKKGTRQLLNLGHTFGHVLESAKRVPHGEAVAQGLYFSLKWSLQKGYITPKDYFECVQLLGVNFKIPCWVEQDPTWRKFSGKSFTRLLLQDKKRSSREKVNFIFLQKWGAPIIQAVRFDDLAKEARRQGWVQ